MSRRFFRTGAALVAIGTLLAGCGLMGGGDDDALVVYNAQHQSLTEKWVEAFTAETGIEVDLRNGSDFDLGNQLIAEGDASRADVYLTENSPAVSMVAGKGLLAPVDAGTLAQVPERYRPSTGDWVGIAARSTVFVYNTERTEESELPRTLQELSGPKWAGRWAARMDAPEAPSLHVRWHAPEGLEAADLPTLRDLGLPAPDREAQAAGEAAAWAGLRPSTPHAAPATALALPLPGSSAPTHPAPAPAGHRPPLPT